MTAHDNELIRAGLNAFITFGDVYRRDEIDAKHYPVFHQCDAARIFTRFDLYESQTAVAADADVKDIFEKNKNELSANKRENNEKQAVYTRDASKLVELDLKNTLTSLVQFIFGSCE
jgi:phenylalanyl-tRNA synthetase alpha chain